MADAAEIPRRPAPTINAVVSSGVGALSVLCPVVISVTVSGAFVALYAASASARSVNLPWIWRASITSRPFWAVRESIQYFSGTNASISFSRSTIIERVGL